MISNFPRSSFDFQNGSALPLARPTSIMMFSLMDGPNITVRSDNVSRALKYTGLNKNHVCKVHESRYLKMRRLDMYSCAGNAGGFPCSLERYLQRYCNDITIAAVYTCCSFCSLSRYFYAMHDGTLIDYLQRRAEPAISAVFNALIGGGRCSPGARQEDPGFLRLLLLAPRRQFLWRGRADWWWR